MAPGKPKFTYSFPWHLQCRKKRRNNWAAELCTRAAVGKPEPITRASQQSRPPDSQRAKAVRRGSIRGSIFHRRRGVGENSRASTSENRRKPQVEYAGILRLATKS